MQFPFPKSHRLHRAQDFTAIFRGKNRLKQGFVWIYSISNPLPHARLGLLVPKKVVKLSTQRHRLKRIIRESFRLNQPQLSSYDIIVRVVGYPPQDQKLLWQTLKAVWQLFETPSLGC